MAKAIAVTLALSACLYQLASGAASGFIAAPSSGASCPTVCSSTGQNPAGLQQFNSENPVESYSCAANVTGLGLLPGYQLTSNTTCTVAQNSSVDMYSDFSCLCVDPSAELGLVAAESGSCDWACNQTADGLVGSTVQPAASTPSDVCIPSADLGHLNRFGHTGALDGSTQGCFSAVDGAAYATASFSCFCLFQSPSALAQGPAVQPIVSDPALATGG